MFHKKCCLQTSFVGIKSHKLAWCPSVKAVFVIPLHHVDAYLHHVDVQMVIIIELFAFFQLGMGFKIRWLTFSLVHPVTHFQGNSSFFEGQIVTYYRLQTIFQHSDMVLIP